MLQIFKIEINFMPSLLFFASCNEYCSRVPILGIIRNITSVFTLCNDYCIRVPILGIIRNISVFTLHNDYCSRVSIFAIIRNIISVFTLQKRILLEKPNKLSNINKLPKLKQKWMMQSLEIYLL